MSTAAAEFAPTPHTLLDVWRELDLPEGWRAEIVHEGSIAVTPPPADEHNIIADLLHRLFARHIDDELGIYQTLGISVVSTGRVYIPDMVIVPHAVLPAPHPPVSAEHALLAVEITSKDNADNDRHFKRRGYATGCVPLYLLIDRWRRSGPSVTLFRQPEGGDYRQDVRVPFGQSIKLPEPFDLEIDTAGFPPGK